MGGRALGSWRVFSWCLPEEDIEHPPQSRQRRAEFCFLFSNPCGENLPHHHHQMVGRLIPRTIREVDNVYAVARVDVRIYRSTANVSNVRARHCVGVARSLLPPFLISQI